MSLVSHLFRFLMVLMVVASTMAQDRPVSLNADPISMVRTSTPLLIHELTG